MVDGDVVREASMRYGALLDGLQAVLEQQLGPLVWKKREDARRVNDRVYGPSVEVGPIRGAGVALSLVDPVELGRRVDDHLALSGYPAAVMSYSPAGEVVYTAQLRPGAALEIRVKGRVQASVFSRLG
ncbi:hypothetical protein [Tessaracoccus sp. OH4464_COT-324]|uniref:hypothetical protein n=1 Tax=Tessaracoccus sp. OH4464_COT-324 TaxID=2491059 RepID=UPI000F63B5A3|nr:hypothetical protein [Tessaracoccus sp. OH4464_COT-324]RRD46606.1 hypothetical protein EII42_06210 [Tessaracoccus sp. OH4464_COT-324]